MNPNMMENRLYKNVLMFNNTLFGGCTAGTFCNILQGLPGIARMVFSCLMQLFDLRFDFLSFYFESVSREALISDLCFLGFYSFTYNCLIFNIIKTLLSIFYILF